MTHLHFVGWIAALALLATTAAWGQAWRPDRVTEFITSSAAGGSNDQVARAMQKLLQDARLITTPIAVANKSGGNLEKEYAATRGIMTELGIAK
jgi:tripartite-type tricarboxylate transporter receptor subunit TctC